MRIRIVKLCILFSLLPLLSSCWDYNEVNRLRYVYGVGIDYKDGKYEVYPQIVEFINIAKTDAPPVQDAFQTEVTKGVGHTVEEAIYNVYNSTDLKLFWGHMIYMVFSEEALKEGRANNVINAFIRNRDTRYQTWVYATTDSVEEILLLNPLFNNSMTRLRLVDPMSSYSQSSFVEPINFRKMILGLNEPSHEVNIPHVTMQKWSNEQEPEVDGVLTISPKESKGIIKKDKIRGLQWMTKETERGEITFKREQEGDYVTGLVDNHKIKVKPFEKGGQVYFDIKISLNVLVGSFEGSITAKEMKRNIQEYMEKEIKETYLEGLKNDADIYRLSEYVYRQELPIWKKHQKNGKVELKEDSIHSITIDVKKVYSGRKKLKETIK